MNKQFILLDNDDDVILINEDSFKLSKLKQIVSKEIGIKMDTTRIYITDNKGQPFYGDLISSFLERIIPSINSNTFNLMELNYFTDCQILKTNGKGWQKGQIKIQIRIFRDRGIRYEIDLSFCPEEPIKLESPLDDIRQMILTE
jgi:hypothetical protein